MVISKQSLQHAVAKKDFDPKLIAAVNGAVGVIYAVAAAGLLGAEFFETVTRPGVVFRRQFL